MTTVKEIQDKDNPCMECGRYYHIAVCPELLGKILKNKVSELRKRNPYKNRNNILFASEEHIKLNYREDGYETACDELEKMG